MYHAQHTHRRSYTHNNIASIFRLRSSFCIIRFSLLNDNTKYIIHLLAEQLHIYFRTQKGTVLVNVVAFKNLYILNGRIHQVLSVPLAFSIALCVLFGYLNAFVTCELPFNSFSEHCVEFFAKRRIVCMCEIHIFIWRKKNRDQKRETSTNKPQKGKMH